MEELDLSNQVELPEPDASSPAVLLRQLAEPALQRSLMSVVLINLFILMCRPQNNFSPLALTRLPVLLSLIPLIVVLPRFMDLWRESRMFKAMIIWLVFGGVWIPFARNNFWAFETFRDQTQQFLCYLFPIFLLGHFGRRIRKLTVCLGVCGVYLGLYSLTHSGSGPGGFLGDENDMALTLNALLGISLAVFPVARGSVSKLICLGAAILSLAGIVATMSRGGFVGLLGLLGYSFWKSTHKLAMIIMAIFIAVAAVTVVPGSYWKEMGTITDTNESTAHGRIEIWKIGMRMWLSPKIFPFGSGMQNTPYHLAEYEPEVNHSEFGRSVGGRALHSSYVQLVCDLGTTGLLLFLFVGPGTLIRNRKNAKLLRQMRQRLGRVQEAIAAKVDGQAEESLDGSGKIMVLLGREIKFLLALLVGINSGLIGTLLSAVFVSALYYPTIWLMAILGATLGRHVNELNDYVSQLSISQVEEPPVNISFV